MRAQGRLAEELEKVKEEYEKLLSAEATRLKEHYLLELQEHLQVQQKVPAVEREYRKTGKV